MKKKEITLGDTTYTSLQEAAREHGIRYHKVWERLKAGWSKEEAFGLVHREISPRDGVKFSIGQLQFNSFSAACRHFGVDRNLAQQRKRMGWLDEEVLGLVPRRKR